jgi:ABC-2 type transport system permease protein
MDKKLFILTKILLKNGFDFSADSKKRAKQIGLIFVVILCFLPMTYEIIKFVSDMYDGLAIVGEQGVLLSLGIAVSALVIFFFGILYSMNTFYFSNEIENLLPLPLKSSQILGAKFIIVTIYEYLTEALILLPIMILFGLKSGASFGFYLYALIIFLILPVIPIGIASVLVMIIMRFTNLSKSKDKFRMISAIFAIAISVGLNTLIQKFALNYNADQIQLGNNSLASAAANIFPPSKFGALSLINSGNLSGLGYILMFLAVSAIGFYLFLLLGDRLYYKGVTGISVASSKKRLISSEELNNEAVRSPVIKSYVKKELRILFRTPSYFINCILMNFLWPVLVAIPMLAHSKSASGIGALSNLFENSNNNGMILAVAFSIILFISSSNGITSTSISREGENIFVNKFIPLSYGTQIISKAISGVIMGIVGMISMGIGATIMVKPPFYLLILIFIVCLPAIVFSNFSGIFIDIYNPKLHWDNEQKAVKQNMNVLLNLIFCVAFGGLSIFLVYSLKLGLIQVALCLVVLYVLLDIVLYKLLMGKGCELFSKIEC